MENNLAEIRRQLLAAEVERQGQSTVAKLAHKPDSQIRDMIAGRKTFGDRVARQIGPLIRPDLPPDWLLSPHSSAELLPSSYMQNGQEGAESDGEQSAVAVLPEEFQALLDTITSTAKAGTLTPEQAADFNKLIKTITGTK